MPLVAPGLALRRLGLAMTDLRLRCPGCAAAAAPAVNSYDRFFYGCPCGRSWSALLGDIPGLQHQQP